MSRFESREFRLISGTEKISAFLGNAENLYEILPQERIEDWKADEEHCSFKIKGLSSLDLHLQENGDPLKVEYRSGERSPFPFTLYIQLEEDGDGSSLCRIFCEAELNSFMEQMARKPFEKLFEHMGERLSAIDP